MVISPQVLGLVCAATAAVGAEAPKRWSIAPPPGWLDISSNAAQRPENKMTAEQLEKSGGSRELVTYSSGQGELQIHFLQLPAGTKPEDTNATALLQFAAGLRDGMKNTGVEQSYTQRTDGDALFAQQVIMRDAIRVDVRSFVALDKGDYFVALSANCWSLDAACGPAVASLQLERSGIKAAGEKEESASLGAQIGRVLVYVVAAALVILLLARERKKKRDANPLVPR